MAARPRTLPAAIAPVFVGTAAAYYSPRTPLARLRRRAPRLDPDPDRHQPRQRLLGRQARRRHGRPPRPGAGHLVGAVGAEARAARDLDRLRARRADGHLPGDRCRARDHRWSASSRSSRASSTPAARALRLRGHGRALRLPLLRTRRRERLLLRPARGDRRAAVVLRVAVGFLSTAILVVNNLRDMHTDAGRASGPWRCGSGRERTQALYIGAPGRRLPPGSGRDRVLRRAGAALISLAAAPLAIKPLSAVRTRTDGPSLNGALAGTGALLGVFSLLLSAGLVWARADSDADRGDRDRRVFPAVRRALRHCARSDPRARDGAPPPAYRRGLGRPWRGGAAGAPRRQAALKG